MCQTPSVTPPPQHPSTAHAPRAQLLPAKEQHGDTLGCETLQHSTLRGLSISPFRLNGKPRNVLGSGCCFGAATQCRSPAGGLDTFSIWFSESSQSLPLHSYLPTDGEGCRDTSPSEPSSGQSSWVTRGPVGSAATSPEPPEPAGIVSLPVYVASWH